MNVCTYIHVQSVYGHVHVKYHNKGYPPLQIVVIVMVIAVISEPVPLCACVYWLCSVSAQYVVYWR